MIQTKPGDRFNVTINGRTYPTVIDEHGVQRFYRNQLFDFLIKNCYVLGEFPENEPIRRRYTRCVADLNQLTIACGEGHFTELELMEFTMSGMSVCGLADMFPGMKINNPLW